MEPSTVVGSLLLGTPLLIFLYLYYYARSVHAKSVGGVKVPRGNFWLFPLLGETIKMLRTPPRDFHYQQTEIYGDTFLSHIAGGPMIVTSNVELTKWVYQQTNKLFSVAFPASTTDLLGHSSLLFLKGDLHTRLRKLIAAPLSTDRLSKFTATVDKIVIEILKSWKTKPRVVILDEAKKYILYLAWAHMITIDTQEYPYLDKMLAGLPGDTQVDKLVQLYYTMERGMLTVPLMIPGTKYYKAMNAREKFVKILTKIIADRKSGAVECQDLLQAMLGPMEDGSYLTDKQVLDNIFTALAAAEISTSTCLVWMVKNIIENPELLKDLKAEHDEILRSKEKGAPLTLQDTRKMTLTLWTMHETLRVESITGPFIGRYADEDILIKDIAIPKNWKVGMTHRFHLDPELYPEPLTFNPRRFGVAPAPNTFVPFGQGVRICPGRELAKLEIMVFFHRFLTMYSYEPAEPNSDIVWYETPHPRNKYPIKVTPLQQIE